ncbi:hypothetical protein AAVH_40751, partial [Aphelenchoides avenae]
MKRQSPYAPSNGALDIIKVLSKLTTNRAANPGGCIEFPACVLAQKRRRKRRAERAEAYHKQIRRYKRALAEREHVVERHKRQFYAPDANANCVPCPAWVTLALLSRRRRDADAETAASTDEMDAATPSNSTASMEETDSDELTGYSSKESFHEAIRRKPANEDGNDECEQTDDCMNDSEYDAFMRKYNLGKRRKRQ